MNVEERAERTLRRVKATQDLARALVRAQDAGVPISYVSDSPLNPFITISIDKGLNEQFLVWEATRDASGRSTAFWRLSLANSDSAETVLAHRSAETAVDSTEGTASSI